MLDYDEEMALEWPEWKEARGREEDAWRLESEGETEVLETVIVSDVVEGTCVDSNGEGHHGRGKVKNHRSQRGVQGEEDEEIKSPKKKVIWVGSEETQDYVREAKSTDQQEVEELSFVSSAISVPQEMIVRCDQCSEETLSFWEFAPVAIRESEESYTTDICEKCYNGSPRAKGEKPLTNWQCRESSRSKRRK